MRILAVICLLGVSLACNSARSTSAERGFVNAEIRGSLVGRYVGNGVYVLQMGATPPSLGFSIVSANVASAHAETVVLAQTPAERPNVGSYDVGGMSAQGAPLRRLVMLYFSSATVAESYVSDSGEVTIDQSSAEEVVGHFAIRLRRYCRREGVAVQGSCLAAQPDNPATTIRLVGTFRAPPAAPHGGPS